MFSDKLNHDQCQFLLRIVIYGSVRALEYSANFHQGPTLIFYRDLGIFMNIAIKMTGNI